MKVLQRLTPREIGTLLGWYRANRRDFPWRRNPEPYWVWLAEIMSQQTRMAALVPYFHRFLERFPSVRDIAEAPEDDVLAAWSGLGYYSRARNLRAAARRIAETGFPRTLEGWRGLPGVGPYTAAAVASQCFGVAEPVWDGNVLRVCARLETAATARSEAFRKQAQDALRAKMVGHDPSDFNQALMELGSEICAPRAPACGRCPLAAVCRAHALKAPEAHPPPKPRRPTVDLAPRVLVRLRKGAGGEDEALLVRRREDQWFPGMWDFPSELGGSRRPIEPFTRELPASARVFGTAGHQITHHRIKLQGWVRLERRARAARYGRWLALGQLCSDSPPVPLSTTARKMVRVLMRRPNSAGRPSRASSH